MKNKILTLAFLFNALLNFAQTPVTIQVGHVQNAVPGTQIHIPIIISGFSATSGKSMSGIDIRFLCDTSIARYTGIDNGSPATPTPEWISGSVHNSVRANWLEPNLSSVTFDDGTVVIEFVMNYKGGNTSLVCEPECEVTDGNFNIIEDAQFLNGSITQASGSGSTQWNGTGIWSEPSFWSNGLPGDSVDAEIVSGSVEILSAAICKNLIVQSGTTLDIFPGASLTVNKNLTNSGEIVVQTDSILSGSMILKGSLSQTGTTSVWKDVYTGQSYLTGSPVANVPASTFTSAGALFSYLEPGNSFQAFSGTTLGNIQGYLFTATSTQRIVQSGVLNGSNGQFALEYSGSATQGWNLLANPFASAFDTDTGLVVQNADKAVYGWNNGRYLVWNGTTGSLINGIIPVGHAFFVKANATNSKAELKKQGAKHNFHYYSGSAPASSKVLTLSLSPFDEPGNSDQAYIQIDENATFGFDSGFDAWKFSNSAEVQDLYILNEGSLPLAISALPFAPAKVGLGISIKQEGAYTLSAAASSFNPGGIVELYDKVLNTTKNLRTETHSFQSAEGTFDDRFELILSGVGITEPSADPQFQVFLQNENIIIRCLRPVSHPASLELLDIMGRSFRQEIHSFTPGSDFQIPALEGVNILRILTHEGIQTVKLISI